MLRFSDLRAVISKPGDHYLECRFQENRDLRIGFLNGQLVTNLQSSKSGVSARSFSSGYWGFSSAVAPTQAALKEVAQEALKNASFLGSRGKKMASLQKLRDDRVSFSRSYLSNKPRVAVSTWIEYLKSIDQMIAAKYPNLKSRSVSLMSLDMERVVRTTDGVEVHTVVPRAHLAIALTLQSEVGPVALRDVRGGLGEPQDLFPLADSELEQWIEKVGEGVLRKANGVLPKAGVADVILAPDLAGILAHEAVGHTTEADLVLGGSVAGDLLGKPVASPLVSLVDYAHTYNGEPAPQPVHVDDEGVLAEDTPIIDRGILTTFMHSRETAAQFDQKATGHARAFLFSDEPLIRMRNTAILPGQSEIEEMIGSIEHGYFLTNPGNGQADTTGEFMFAVGAGYEIENGKLSRPLRDATISGVAFDMLKSVTMVSKDFAWESSGYCGKKQPMPVGMGGPAIKCRLSLGGQ